MRDPLEEQLRAWGNAQVGRHAANDDRDTGPGSHPIARAREFAPMTREKFANQVAGRDGRDRRRMMAAACNTGPKGGVGLRIVPMWACDPVAGKETRLAGPSAAVDYGLPPELRLLDSALMELYRANTLCGLCLRFEYTRRGWHDEKAKEVARTMGIKELTVRQFREQLKAGKQWLRIELRIAA